MALFFSSFARRTFRQTRNPRAFTVAVAIVFCWALTGPLFHFSDTWQLVINTGTTIVTFLLGFILNFAQGEAETAQQEQSDRIETGEHLLNDHMELVNRKLDVLLERAQEARSSSREESSPRPAS